MKKYIIAVIALLVLATGSLAHAYSEGSASPSAKRETGAPGYVPYKEVQLVRFAENAPSSVGLSAGDVVLWNVVSDDGVTVQLFASGMSVDAVAGVVVSPTIGTCETVGTTPGIDYGRRNWGFMQTRGLCPVVNIDAGPVLPGAAIYASSTVRYATKSGVYNSGNRSMGFAYDASSQGQAEAFLDL